MVEEATEQAEQDEKLKLTEADEQEAEASEGENAADKD